MFMEEVIDVAAEEYCDGKARIVIREDFCLRKPEDIEELLQRIKQNTYGILKKKESVTIEGETIS